MFFGFVLHTNPLRTKWSTLKINNLLQYMGSKFFSFKGSIFLKKKTFFFFIQGRFNKLIYGINMIIKCGILQPVKFPLVSRV